MENLAAQSVFQQFLEKFPRQLGSILNRACNSKARYQAIKSLSTRDVTNVRQSITERMVGPLLAPDDHISILHMHDKDTYDECVTYRTVAVHTIDNDVVGVLTLWLEDFYKRVQQKMLDDPNGSWRVEWFEHDGTPKLELEGDLHDNLEDFIDSHVENVIADKYAEAEHGGRPNEESENGFGDSDDDSDVPDYETKTEEVRESLEEFLCLVPAKKPVDLERLRIYRPMPKITIRNCVDQ